MFPAEKSKKSRKSTSTTEETEGTDAPEPIDVLVDTILGFLEKGTAYMRSVANHVFSILSGSVRESTIDLIVAVRHISSGTFDSRFLKPDPVLNYVGSVCLAIGSQGSF